MVAFLAWQTCIGDIVNRLPGGGNYYGTCDSVGVYLVPALMLASYNLAPSYKQSRFRMNLTLFFLIRKDFTKYKKGSQAANAQKVQISEITFHLTCTET